MRFGHFASLAHFARQRFSRLGIAYCLPVVCLVLACVAFVASSVAASACGMPWGLPSTPFVNENSGDYRFQYWEELGSVTIPEIRAWKSDTPLAISLNLGFNPLSNYTSSLGVGFELAIFDSRLTWADNNKVQLHRPNGGIVKFAVKGKNRLEAFEWQGIFNPKTLQATIKAPCNWVLNFEGNRLSSFRSPEGVVFSITRLATGEQQLLQDGRIIVSLKPDWDPKTTRKFYRLKFGDKTVILRMGTRPVVIKGKAKNERILMTPALASIEYANWNENDPFSFLRQKDRKVSFKGNEIKLGGIVYEWEQETGRLCKENITVMEYPRIKGIPCIRKKNLISGKTILEGADFLRSVSQYDSGPICLTTYLPPGRNHRLRDELRELIHINRTGEETLVRKAWYNENGEVISIYFLGKDNEGLIQRFGRDNIVFEHAKSKRKIWECKYNDKGDIIYWKTQTREYAFEHKKETNEVIAILKGSGQTKTISEEKFKSMFSQLRITQSLPIF